MSLTELERDFFSAVQNTDKAKIINYLESEPSLLTRSFSFGNEKRGTTIFHILATSGVFNGGLKIILENIPNVDLYDPFGNTALHIACRYGNFEAVKSLVTRGADILKEDRDGNNALHLSCLKSQTKIAEYLVSTAKKNFNKERFIQYINSKTLIGISPLFYATHKNNHEIIKLLLDNKARVDTTSLGKITPLHLSVEHCDQLHLTKRMVEKGADLNLSTKEEKYTPIMFAAKSNCSNTVEFLASMGANLDFQTITGKTALLLASARGYDDVAKTLLQYTADANIAEENQITPLHVAVMKDNHKISEYLLANNAEKDALDSAGNTPMFIAALYESKSTLEVLYNKSGANLTYVKPTDGSGIIHAAALGGNIEIIDMINNYNSSLLYSYDHNFGTVLHYAVANNNVKLVRHLINKYKFNIELRDKNGFSALHIAVLNGNRETTETLIELGADYNARSFLDFNVYEIASYVRAKNVTQYLESKDDIAKVSTNSWLNYGKNLVNDYLYQPLCAEESSESPFASSIAEEVLTGVGSAALEAGKGILAPLSTDYCKIYKLGNHISPLRSAKSIHISKSDCVIGQREAYSIQNYGPDNFNICLNKPDRFSKMLSSITPTTPMTMAGLTLAGKWYGYDYVTFSHQRVKGFWNGVKQSTMDYNGGLTILDLLGINNIQLHGHEIKLSGGLLDNLKTSSYIPKLAINLYQTGKFFLYEDNSDAIQLVIREISTLRQDRHFYLAQHPSECSYGDSLAYNLTSGQATYKICESDIKHTYLDMAYNAINTLATSLPILSTLKSFHLSIAAGPVAVATAMGSLSIGIITMVTNWGVNIFTDAQPSLAQYYANKFMDHHEDEGLYLAEYPAICADKDDSIPYVFFYQIGDWSVCGKKEIVAQYTVQNRYYDKGFMTLWGVFSSDDVINMDKYGLYRGGKGEDRFIIFKEFAGKKDGFKLIIDDFEPQKDILDFTNFDNVNDMSDLSFSEAVVKDKRAITISGDKGKEIVTLKGITKDHLVAKDFLFGEQHTHTEL